MVKHEPVRIVTNPILRDERTERRIMEFYRMRTYYGLLVAGAVMLLIALMWTG